MLEYVGVHEMLLMIEPTHWFGGRVIGCMSSLPPHSSIADQLSATKMRNAGPSTVFAQSNWFAEMSLRVMAFCCCHTASALPLPSMATCGFSAEPALLASISAAVPQPPTKV